MSVIPGAPTETTASNTSSHAPTTLSAQSSHLFQHASGFDIVGGQFVLGDVHNHHPKAVPEVGVSLPLLNFMDEDFSESEIYCNQLLRRKRGFPLYDPAPPQNLPVEYRRKGVAIGDVGRVTPEGCFDFGFNIYLPANHPINNNDVPENFCPLTSYAPRDLFSKDYAPGNHLSTDSVQKVDFHHDFPGGDFVFRCIAPQGAVLALPGGAHSEKLENLELLRAYVAIHAESWYRYMNITRGRGLENGLLYLVTGCEKVQSWGMASFRGIHDEFQLEFKPTPRANSTSQYRWRGLYGHQNPAQSKSSNVSTDNTPWNQTTFIHGLSISLGAGIWGKLFGKVDIREIGDSALRSTKGNPLSTTSNHSQFSWSFGFIGGGPGAGRNYCADEDVQACLSNISPNSKIFNPGQLINSYILHKAPQATVVLSHDDDWRDILADSDNSSAEFTIQDVSEFLQRIRVGFDITETHGATFLQSRSRGEPVSSSSPPPPARSIRSGGRPVPSIRLSYLQPPNGNGMRGPPPPSSYANSSSLTPRRSGQTMQVILNLVVNQYVEVRLDVNSPWIIGLVLAVCEVVGKSFGFEYEIKYQVGQRTATRVFPANSPNLRAPQDAPQYTPQYVPQAPQYAPQAPQSPESGVRIHHLLSDNDTS